ncbi:unnamed protein product [Paramecium primaurelia]|uniref:WD domain, G-beta repeat protein n=1 Tax=Paramecium primaurelia TaxID=5886 RepID=A0A8S1M766_PARPR|nr:unnamed protein product [Paramecium primaurelia]
MFQPKMIELEEQLICSKNHKSPIQMVLLDKNLKREERLLCAICLENFEGEAKIIGIKKVLQKIQDNQQKKVENIQKLINIDVDLVESFVSELKQLKSKIIQQFDELISYSSEWIQSLNNIGQYNSQYSFYEELEIVIKNNQMQNLFNEQSIIAQITKLNNQLYDKINMKLSALRDQVLYSQCDKALINLNQHHNMKLIDNSIIKAETCYAISFNQSGSLMISASNYDIIVWKFEKGKMNEITKISGHTQTISCLQFSQKSNSFVSAGFDNSIRCWNQINQKEWKSSQSYTQHTNCINCLILNQSENQLISGGRDKSIKIWKIDFTNNQLTYLYYLDKHTNNVYSLCFNQSEDTLVSCGDESIIIWKMDNLKKWQFGQVVTKSINEFGYRLCFINNDQFIQIAGNQISKDCISTFELKNEKYQENLSKELKLIKNDQTSDLNLFPIFHVRQNNLMIVKHKYYVYLIKISNEGQLKIITYIKFESNYIFGALSYDGRYLVIWEKVEQKFHIYELNNN